jgi:tetratricopeptide (TPR) repeat protein
MGRLKLKCLIKEITHEDITTTIESLRRSYFSTSILTFTQDLGSLAKTDRCPPFNKEHHHKIIQTLIMSGLDKEQISGRWRTALHGLYLMLGNDAYKDGELTQAQQYLDLAYEIHPIFDTRLKQIKWFIDDGQYDKALEYINIAERKSEQQIIFFLPNPHKPKIKRAKEYVEKARMENRLENQQKNDAQDTK